MSDIADFDLSKFLPYLLNQAADRQSVAFRQVYREHYGMLRMEWRVLFHLGQFGDMTAKDICAKAQMHKTKASRAVAALELKRFLVRSQVATDRRRELLSLTPLGHRAYVHLNKAAHSFDSELQKQLGSADTRVLIRCLIKLSAGQAD